MRVRPSPIPSLLPGSRRATRWLSMRGMGSVPVVVYQMAKVGSTSIVDALLRSRLPVFQVHRMSPSHMERVRAARVSLGWRVHPPNFSDRLGSELYRRVIQSRRPARIITLVRDPIARNLSSYFEHLDDIWQTERAHERISLDELCKGFLARYTHHEPLTWFDDELFPVTGVNVFGTAFPESGQIVIRGEHYDVLVLRSDLADHRKTVAVSSFLGLDIGPVASANRTESKAKGKIYKMFRSRLRLPRSYVEELLESGYARHFFSDAERTAMRFRYGGDVDWEKERIN